jgi:hypothetical protein
MNMENETKKGTLKVMDDGKLVKEITFDLVWQGGQTLLAEISKLVNIPNGLQFKTLSERWSHYTNILGFELSLSKYNHWGSKHLFRRVMLKPSINEDHPTSTIDLATIRSKITELMPELAEENERKQNDAKRSKEQAERRKTFAPLLTQLASQHGWECKVSDPVYSPESITISRQTDLGKVSIENGYGDVKIKISLNDYDPTTLEKLVHFLSGKVQ